MHSHTEDIRPEDMPEPAQPITVSFPTLSPVRSRNCGCFG
jgi:hypothetical protein